MRWRLGFEVRLDSVQLRSERHDGDVYILDVVKDVYSGVKIKLGRFTERVSRNRFGHLMPLYK